MKVRVLCVGICLMMGAACRAGSLANFDDLLLIANSYWNGSDGSGDFVNRQAHFNNSYFDYGGGYFSWGGCAYSNIKDTSSFGLASQYNAIPGGAQDGDVYGIGYIDSYNMVNPTIAFNTEQLVGGLYVTNVNYAYYSMRDGYMVAKKFGGDTGNDPDWFKLTVTGKDSQGDVTGTVDFYLADFRFDDNSQDYIVNTWEYVDLSSLGAVKSFQFGLSSTDNDPVYGMNTPAYFAFDTVVPEPATMVLLGLGMLLMRKGKKK